MSTTVVKSESKDNEVFETFSRLSVDETKNLNVEKLKQEVEQLTEEVNDLHQTINTLRYKIKDNKRQFRAAMRYIYNLISIYYYEHALSKAASWFEKESDVDKWSASDSSSDEN